MKPNRQAIEEAFFKAIKNREELVRKDSKKEEEAALLQQALRNGQLIAVSEDEHGANNQHHLQATNAYDNGEEDFYEGQRVDGDYSDNNRGNFDAKDLFG